MLLSLAIQDFVIVDRVRLEFARGFSVLTGETGAGKSILVDALMLVLGGRADSSVVRQGRERAEVSAEFDASSLPALQAWLAGNDLAGEDGECILRRVIDAGGRSRAYVNGRPCTAAQLREAGEYLVDIHGQHEHQSLMRPASQRVLLDAYAGAGDTVARGRPPPSAVARAGRRAHSRPRECAIPGGRAGSAGLAGPGVEAARPDGAGMARAAVRSWPARTCRGAHRSGGDAVSRRCRKGTPPASRP